MALLSEQHLDLFEEFKKLRKLNLLNSKDILGTQDDIRIDVQKVAYNNIQLRDTIARMETEQKQSSCRMETLEKSVTLLKLIT